MRMRTARSGNLFDAMLGLALVLAMVFGVSAPAVAQEQPAAGDSGMKVVTTNAPPVRIGSRWIASTFLNIEGGKLQNSVIQLGWVSSMWTIDTVEGDRVRIRNVWQQDQYLNVDGGALDASAVPPESTTAQWTMEPIGKGFYVRFRNVGNPELYLNVAEGKLQASPIQQDSLSADWWLLK